MPLYFLSTLVYFWAPVAALAWHLWPKLDPLTRKAFWCTMGIFYTLAFGMEYLYLYLQVWTFSEKLDPLLGIRIFNAPVEEFCFWFGATPFALFTYLGLDRMLRPPTTPVKVPEPRGARRLVLLQ
jgi:lycopene cyclase domain-containing protein